MIRSSIRLLLGPVLLWQGAQVRRDILRMPEAEGRREGETGKGQPLSVLLLGDSSIAGVGAATQDHALSGRLTERLSQTHAVSWRVVGTTGWTTDDALQALRTETPQPTDIAILSLGVNDVTTETGIAAWLETYCALIQSLRDNWHTRMIILSGLPPMGAFPALPQPLRWYMGLQADAHQAALFKRFADERDTVRLPLVFDLDPSAMAEDGFHPGPLVYDAWAKDIAGLIHQHFPQMPPRRPARAIDAARRSTGT